MFLRTAFINQIMSKSKGKVFYAVGIGHKTGVYDSWSDCKKQVEGVSNPKFKKFDTLEGAQDFVKQWQSKSPNAHASPISPKQCSSSQHSRLSDSNQGEQHSLQQKGDLERTVDNITPTTIDMEEAEEGGGDAIDLNHLRENMRLCERKFDTLFCKFTEFFSCLTNVRNELKEMRKLLPRNGVLRNEMGSRKLEAGMTPNFSRSFAMNCDDGELCDAFKIQKEDSQRLGTVRTESTSSSGDISCQPTPAKRKRTWDEFRSSSKEPSLNEKIKEEHDDYVPFTTDEDDYVVVFTDGSCVSNGTLKAKAGIGIWFDDGHPLNVSRPLTGVEPTNNNAEIQAARIACELALSAGITKLKICTDSEFLINCITKWVKKWKSNGWMTGANKPVKNRVELEKLLDVISRLSVRWEKVEAHSNIKGNEMADRLANDGASCYVK